MAIRLRQIEGEWVALCAAKTKALEGDVYLDDALHYALALKFGRDFGLVYDSATETLVASIEVENEKALRLWEQNRRAV